MTRTRVLVGVGLLGIVCLVAAIVYFTWQSIQAGERISAWSYSQLLDEAQKGQVVTAVIRGQSAVATDRGGQKHVVTLSGDPSADAKVLEADGVNVTFEASSTPAFWIQVLVPNLILLVILGGPAVALTIFLIRRASR